MIAPVLQTLFLPLESGDVPDTGPALFANADWHPSLKKLSKPFLWQPFKPLADRLAAQGLTAEARIPDEGEKYSLAVVHLPKQVQEAKYLLAAACSRLGADGWLVAGAANDANGNRIETWFEELGFAPQSVSKHKARAVWAQKRTSADDVEAKWITDGAARRVELGGGISLQTQPGLFSWDRIDQGSRLLATHLPENIKGIGADFGAGIGYLSQEMLRRPHRLSNWHVLEADARALDCTRENLRGSAGEIAVEYHWTDLTRPVRGLPPLDIAIMNPPFHHGKVSDISVGQAFIRTAGSHIKKNGRLFMVANAHLPYEAVIAEIFSTYKILTQTQGFKIIEAVK